MRRFALLLSAWAIACDREPDAGERVARTSSPFTSHEATLVDFELDGTIATDTKDETAVRALIGAQLMYSVGALNAESSVGRAAGVEISDIHRTNGNTFRYHAKLPVAWGRKDVPSSYVLTLPRRAARTDQNTFAAKYGPTCADADAGPPPIHPSTMFLHFRPNLPSCVLDAEDVVTVTANVTASTGNTTGKYPEYDRIWDDRTLNVVALFSRAEAGGADEADEGARAYARFATDLRREYDVADEGMPIVKRLPDGRSLHVEARIVDAAIDSTPDIDAWYAARTAEADLILYNGHAGLGSNVRSLMQKGQFRTGKYAIVSLNACDTFAYLDDTITAPWRALNPDDPAGTKYVDVISNVMPGYFGNGASMSLTLIRALVDRPVTYDEILSRLDPAQVASVTGEEDNAFVPSDPVASTTAPAPGPGPAPAPGDWGLPPERDETANEKKTEQATAPDASAPASCSSAPSRASSSALPLLMLVLAVRRWRPSSRPGLSASRSSAP